MTPIVPAGDDLYVIMNPFRKHLPSDMMIRQLPCRQLPVMCQSCAMQVEKGTAYLGT